MKAMKTLDDLLAHELKDLLSAEKQITKALPKMIKSASSQDLQEALQSHLEETEEHVSRLEKIFEKLDLPTRAKCPAMEGLIEEGYEFSRPTWKTWSAMPQSLPLPACRALRDGRIRLRPHADCNNDQALFFR